MGNTVESIAIVGMAGKFPGANNIKEFWSNLLAGKESIRFFSDDELLSSGIDPAELEQPNYVRAKGILEDADCFDEEFFDYTPREAELMDPQQRVLLEVAYAALEDAGCNPKQYDGDIGVFASATHNTYLLHHVLHHTHLLNDKHYYQVVLNNSNDFLATRIAYKLNLQGPAQTIQTGCSSSLVTIHTACQSILNYECDMALAGGVSISVPLKTGYLFKKEGIHSPEGHCRPFDKAASGTLAGNGCGMVVLKRLSDAIAHRDRIYAVVKGSAVNNDGNNKIGYTAPSIHGQAKVIQMAQALANTPPETIQYIEAHGTGTRIGDPIEIAGLTRAFGKYLHPQWCAIGSLKGNIGHLDAAAGVAGFIKAALSLYHGVIPPSINFSEANPEIDFASSPFFVNTRAQPWPKQEVPNRAGVSAFGIGGTNAHVILEEMPQKSDPISDGNDWHILPISAKTPEALLSLEDAFLTYLRKEKPCLANVTYTLKARRIVYSQRKILLCRNIGSQIEACVFNQSFPVGISFAQQKEIEAWLSGESLETAFLEANVEVTTLPTYPFARTRHWLPEASETSRVITLPKKASAITDTIEQELADILQGLLGVSDLSFAEEVGSYGADSFSLVDFVLEMEAKYAVQIPQGIVTEKTCINQIAVYLREKNAAAPADNKIILFSEAARANLPEKLLVHIKEGDKQKAPLFCLHPAGGSVSVFQELANYLNTDQRVIGIRGILCENSSDIELMAKQYKKIIQTIQPSGPYLLCGSSMGGTIAFELAHILHNEGHAVPLLAMLDTPCPGATYGVVPNSDQEILDYISSLSPKMATDLKKTEIHNPKTQKQFLDVWRAHRDALMRYAGKAYPGNIVYFKAKELTKFQTASFEHGWTPLAVEGIEIHEVAGNHLTMHLSPNVIRIAETLNKKLHFIALQQLFLQTQSSTQKYIYA